MQFKDWESTYQGILDDMGYDRSSDESSVRLMKAILSNSDLIDDDDLRMHVSGNVVVAGGAPFLIKDIPKYDTLIATGASIPYLLENDIIPDVIVTDLDGDLDAQKKASSRGSLTLMHAHGDNIDAIMNHAKDFKGRIMMTTQSKPDIIVYNFGGFTDGDRAVCMADSLGAKKIMLIGFDFDNPVEKSNSSAVIKKKKLDWAKMIIGTMVSTDIVFL